MERFCDVTGEKRENLLMETAMSIMDIYKDMVNQKKINPDDYLDIDSIAMLQMFSAWAREFEDSYYDTDEYVDDWIGLIDSFATRKIEEVFKPKPMLVATVETLNGEKIEILKWGHDGYSAEFLDGDYSVRGSFADINKEVGDYIGSIN